MTPNEISAMSCAVAQHYGLWTPGQMCNYGDVRCRHFDEPLAHTWEELTQGKFKPHEIPCPDLTQPEWAWWLLKATRADILGQALDTGEWQAWLVDVRDDDYHAAADTPEAALLAAAYQLVQREKIK